MVHGAFLYFLFSGIDWFFFFDRTYLKHPKFLKNQVFREILTAGGSIPVVTGNPCIVVHSVLWRAKVELQQTLTSIDVKAEWPLVDEENVST